MWFTIKNGSSDTNSQFDFCTYLFKFRSGDIPLTWSKWNSALVKVFRNSALVKGFPKVIHIPETKRIYICDQDKISNNVFVLDFLCYGMSKYQAKIQVIW